MWMDSERHGGALMPEGYPVHCGLPAHVHRDVSAHAANVAVVAALLVNPSSRLL